MDLNHLHIAAPDVDATVDFYQKYFDFHKKQKLESGSYFIYNRKGFMMAVVKCEARAEMPKWYHHGFRLPSIEDVEQLYDRLKREGQTITEELEKYDDFVVFRCQDPGGFVLEVYWAPGALELK
jgi:predicted enzyme related to lactoylglutathione lyase